MATDAPEPLAAGFDEVALPDWEARARGKDDAERPLTTQLDDGVEARWLYTAEDELAPDPGGAPGHAPFVRGVRAGRPWDIRQEHGQAERRAAHDAILEDLEGGVTAVCVRFDRAARSGAAPGSDAFAAARGRDGVAISTLDDLDEVLADVQLDLAPIALDAGAAGPAAAALLLALWERRGHDPAALKGALRVDPIGAAASDGLVAGQLEGAVAAAGRLAAEVAGRLPDVTVLAVDTRAFVDAGASAVQELALAVSAGVAYLRAMEAAGLEPAAAARRLELTLSVGPDEFLELAKLRALRRLWARVLEASGVEEDLRWSATYARTARRMLAGVDPWVNMLRDTSAAFAAAAGGADGISVTPFDAVLGDPGPLGRRIARNTQLILADESQLARVGDPAGGSWYVESLTDELARAAWAQLQELEGTGGVIAALADGSLAATLGARADDRREQIATRARTLTGVNAFALLDEEPVKRPPAPDLDELVRREAERLDGGPADVSAITDGEPGGRLQAAIDAATAGARIDELVTALVGGELAHVEPLPAARDAEGSRRWRRLGRSASESPESGSTGSVATATSSVSTLPSAASSAASASVLSVDCSDSSAVGSVPESVSVTVSGTVSVSVSGTVSVSWSLMRVLLPHRSGRSWTSADPGLVGSSAAGSAGTGSGRAAAGPACGAGTATASWAAGERRAAPPRRAPRSRRPAPAPGGP